MVVGTQETRQELMQLILKSSKSSQGVLHGLELAQAGELEKARESLEVANAQNIEAHNLQTALIQRELRGEGSDLSLLAIHAQDHFMNSYLLVTLSELFLHQIEEITDLKKKIEKLEQVGEKT